MEKNFLALIICLFFICLIISFYFIFKTINNIISSKAPSSSKVPSSSSKAPPSSSKKPNEMILKINIYNIFQKKITINIG